MRDDGIYPRRDGSEKAIGQTDEPSRFKRMLDEQRPPLPKLNGTLPKFPTLADFDGFNHAAVVTGNLDFTRRLYHLEERIKSLEVGDKFEVPWNAIYPEDDDTLGVIIFQRMNSQEGLPKAFSVQILTLEGVDVLLKGTDERWELHAPGFADISSYYCLIEEGAVIRLNRDDVGKLDPFLIL